MEYDSMLRVKNLSPTLTYTFSYNSQRAIIGPGKTGLATFDALVVALGDPRSGPESTQIYEDGRQRPITIPSRKDELVRLGILYGLYTTHPDHRASEYYTDVAGLTLRDVMPHVEVYNIDSEEPLIFPIDDPDCAHYLPQDTDMSAVAALQRQVEQLGRQQAILQERLRQTQSGDLDTPPEELPEDTPAPDPNLTRRPRTA